ncbi:MAG: hypothetical protein LBH19_10255 [Dysgonamonadaceae bacterium]|jgi:uncharacterized protein (DUF608 family)|nr:hypothetical protein [Dysgonamonadaceae bacterium]
MKRITFILFILLQAVVSLAVTLDKAPAMDGYPVANFALTVNASENGDLYGRILQNSGKLGEWLENKSAVIFHIEKNGNAHPFSGFKRKQVNREFPFVKNEYANSSLTKATVGIETFCPLAINDALTSSLPVLLLQLTCANPSKADETFYITVKPETLFAEKAEAYKTELYSGVTTAQYRLACNAETHWENGKLSIPVTLKPGERKTFRIAIALYDNTWVSANQFRDVSEITDYVQRFYDVLKEKTATFGAAIPHTGDTELDKYLRWYMIPGISLTKYTKNNEVLTMGYCELNQRDSYWTSWLHLVLFKDIEWKMIEESIAAQQPSGKIPTTILPLIERHDDLDINAFFILRVARFFKYYHNRSELASCWPALKNAMDWLLSRDCSGEGLPCQISFWGDWKDVLGVSGRKYSPFSGLIYLGALKQMVYLSDELNDIAAKQKYEAACQKGCEFINRPVEEGGLWNGSYYCQRWNDGAVNDHLLQDQTIGILLDVTPHERAAKIIDALNTQSLTAYGIAETTPYYPSGWGYAPATYHNGAVWPWLSFMDCWSRIRMGRKAEAIEMVKKVAVADLVTSGDWSPNEHINSLTGENLGFILQGWNAGLFGLVYFGLTHPDIIIF